MLPLGGLAELAFSALAFSVAFSALAIAISTLDDNRTQFVASTRGYGGDNAQDPDDLTDLQKSRMVELLYVNTQCVTMR